MKVFVLSVENLEESGEAHPIKVYTDKVKAQRYMDKLEEANSYYERYEYKVEEFEVDGKPYSYTCEGVEE